MDPQLNTQVYRYRKDYESQYGTMGTAVFVCPFTSEKISDIKDVCKGHIFNKCVNADQSFWVPQWKAIDNKYGSIFEADFEIDLLIREHSLVEVIRHEKANKAINLRVNERSISFTTNVNMIDNSEFIKFKISDGEEDAIICVHRSKLEFVPNEAEISLDLQINPLAFFVTVLKSAFLFMFRIHGYRFAYSAGGDLIGRNLLGRFFKERIHTNRDIKNDTKTSNKSIQDSAFCYFRDYFCLIHPIHFTDEQFHNYLDSENRVSSKPHFLAVVDLNEKPWAYCVLIKIRDTYYTILLPNSDHPIAPEKYDEYLRLKGDVRLWCRPMYFDLQGKSWHIEKTNKFQIPPCKIDSLEVNFEYEIELLDN